MAEHGVTEHGLTEHGVIDAYLRELRASLARLPDVDDIVDEARDHLLEAADHLGEHEALARFGSASLVARVFEKEAKKGAAVSTTRTRWAGLAAAVTPVILAIGAWGNDSINAGAAHGVAVLLLLAALVTFVIGLWGLRARHGGLGRMGRAAFWLTVASPFIAAPFAWGAVVAWLAVMAIVLVLLSIGMLRAQVLPVVPIVLFAIGPVGSLGLGLGVTAMGGDAGTVVRLPFFSTFVGFMWLGWTMWREPALDVSASRRGPFATA